MGKNSGKIVGWGLWDTMKGTKSLNRCSNYLRKENICRVGVDESMRGLVRFRWEYGGRK